LKRKEGRKEGRKGRRDGGREKGRKEERKEGGRAQRRWLTPVILATKEAEIRIAV
jgi:hypothetical protein